MTGPLLHRRWTRLKTPVAPYTAGGAPLSVPHTVPVIAIVVVLVGSGIAFVGPTVAPQLAPTPAAPAPGPGHADGPRLALPPLGLGGADGAAGPSIESANFRLATPGATGSELNVGVAPNGHIFVGGWNGVYRSVNDGFSWTRVASEPVPGLTVAADRVLIVDHDTGRILKDDTDLACTAISFSDDDGNTWTHSPIACGGGVTDHQKIAVGKRVSYPDPTGLLYPNVIYACANGLAAGNCGVSIDGGITFLTSVPHGIGCAFQGTPVTDAAGALYEPTSQCGAHIRKTVDNGLHWTDIAVDVDPSDDTPDMAVSPDGTLYYFYTGTDWKPALARSLDGGATWEDFPVVVPGLVSSVFPVIVAGDDGRVGLAFYGTTDERSGWDHNPGSADDDVRWHAYVAVVTDAASAAPTIVPEQVTPASDPLHYGCVSKLGGCGGNPIADYMDIDVGPDGRVVAIFVDACNSSCTGHAQSTRSDALVAIQTGGATLKA